MTRKIWFLPQLVQGARKNGSVPSWKGVSLGTVIKPTQDKVLKSCFSDFRVGVDVFYDNVYSDIPAEATVIGIYRRRK